MLHIRDIWKENPTQGKCYISIDFENNLGSAKIDHLLDTRKVTVNIIWSLSLSAHSK